ncbi:MAG TPA: hypothetical protein VHO68_09140, partial [Bacteroidales bacterium]|nr:hypothetical protein [Bacteroidales bacterium]
MNKLSRRQFFEKGLVGLGSAFMAVNLHGKSLTGKKKARTSLPAGFQIWTVKDMLLKDFAGTLKTISALGYESVEMCSPPGYGFAPLMKMTAREMKNIINDAGLKFESTHYTMNEFRKNLDERIAFASESGQKQMILSSFGLPQTATMDDWKKAADELNKYGEKTK